MLQQNNGTLKIVNSLFKGFIIISDGTKWGCAYGIGFALLAGVIKQVMNAGLELLPDSPPKVWYRHTPKYHEYYYKPKEIKPPENY